MVKQLSIAIAAVKKNRLFGHRLRAISGNALTGQNKFFKRVVRHGVTYLAAPMYQNPTQRIEAGHN
jgi:hypothetical protein